MFLLYVVISGIVPPLFHKEADLKTSLSGETNADTQERILCVDDNREALIWRLRMIEAAEEEIVLSTFDFRADNSGQDMMAALLNAAQRGVNVRVIIDGISGTFYLQCNRIFQAFASHPNIQVRFYNPINLLTPWKLNYRLHDKYLIVDDAFYILGGRNTNDLFLGEYQEKYNVDRDVLVCSGKGSGSVSQVKDYFTQIWGLPCCKQLAFCSEKYGKELKRLEEHYEELLKQYPETSLPIDWQTETIEAESVHLLTNPIEPENKKPKLWEQLCLVMRQGKQIIIETPYIICDDAMYDALTGLCDEGRQIQIIVNAVESGANPFGCTDYLNEKDNILRTGSEVFELMAGQSLHTKTVLADDRISVIGSYNLDIRSTYLDTELMLVIDCPQLNDMLRKDAAAKMDMSRHVMPDGTESPGINFREKEMPFFRQISSEMLKIFSGLFRHLL
ncbi:MAG: phospholipase D family protein [Lachnospiraceae bacterium]|nr:phospholipase D family protein [Lachnospiraceae bacterium]